MICFIVIIYNLPLHVHLFSVSDFLSSNANLNLHVYACPKIQVQDHISKYIHLCHRMYRISSLNGKYI